MYLAIIWPPVWLKYVLPALLAHEPVFQLLSRWHQIGCVGHDVAQCVQTLHSHSASGLEVCLIQP